MTELAQFAVDRLASTAHELIIEGDSYRCRQKSNNYRKTDANISVSVDQQKKITMPTDQIRWSLGHGKPLVPSR